MSPHSRRDSRPASWHPCRSVHPRCRYSCISQVHTNRVSRFQTALAWLEGVPAALLHARAAGVARRDTPHALTEHCKRKNVSVPPLPMPLFSPQNTRAGAAGYFACMTLGACFLPLLHRSRKGLERPRRRASESQSDRYPKHRLRWNEAIEQHSRWGSAARLRGCLVVADVQKLRN